MAVVVGVGVDVAVVVDVAVEVIATSVDTEGVLVGMAGGNAIVD